MLVRWVEPPDLLLHVLDEAGVGDVAEPGEHGRNIRQPVEVHKVGVRKAGNFIAASTNRMSLRTISNPTAYVPQSLFEEFCGVGVVDQGEVVALLLQPDHLVEQVLLFPPE